MKFAEKAVSDAGDNVKIFAKCGARSQNETASVFRLTINDLQFT
jgi:hypothetical protein